MHVFRELERFKHLGVADRVFVAVYEACGAGQESESSRNTLDLDLLGTFSIRRRQSHIPRRGWCVNGSDKEVFGHMSLAGLNLAKPEISAK